MKAARLAFLLSVEASLAAVVRNGPIVEKRQIAGVLGALASGDVGILGALGSVHARVVKSHANRPKMVNTAGLKGALPQTH